MNASMIHKGKNNLLRPLLLLLAGACGTAHAGAFDFGSGLSGHYNLTGSYAAAMRTQSPSGDLVDGPVDPATGLPTTANFDDGDRNFDRGSLVNNRLGVLGELFTEWRGYGLALRGDAFYDHAYDDSNDHDSPATVNHAGDHDEFTHAAHRYSRGRARLLDAYVWGNWSPGGESQVDLRVGRQVVAWGEGLYFGNIAFSQGPSDATKVNVPGIDVKSILLPVEQVSMNVGVTHDLTLMAYYHLRYKPSELEPVGAYFSTADLVGPGAEFGHGFANPLYGVIPGARPVITIPREDDDRPRDGGQWGVGLKYQLTMATNVGLYALRYHDTLPAVVLTPGFPELAPGITTAPNEAPVAYHLAYFDDIDLVGASFSTKVWDLNLAGEVLHRDGANVLVQGAMGPTSTRGEVSQAFLSAITIVPPNFVSQQIDLVGEVGYIHVDDVDGVDGSDTLVNDRNAWAFTSTATFNYRNVFSKWDLAVPVTFAAMVDGTPGMAGAMGSLYGEGDMRAAIGATFTFLQNLQVGLSFNAFLGSPDLAERPYADRDYVAINLKYTL
ncbi:MAG TPA: DUF1302 family protein [Nevskiaceae bacterium]|nr:DUF1302 family protein [Nevskiaceae bacterium]